MYWIDSNNNYYEGDSANINDIAVPQRPDASYKLNTTKDGWIINKSYLISQLNNKYAPLFQSLQLSAGAALLNCTDWTSLMTYLTTTQQQNSDLKAQKLIEQGVILNGS